MKKLCFIFILGIVSIINSLNAQVVSYTYKPFAIEGCTMRYSVTKDNDKYYIIATVSSDNLKFIKEPTMMVRTTNGDVIKFTGELIDNDTKTTGVVSGNMIIPVTSVMSTAQFEVLPSQFDLLKDGIIKVRLTTIPIEHEREFKNDKIGKKLYEFFLEAKNKGDDF